MRTIVIAMLLIFTLAPMAYADFITAAPLGQGKMVFEGTVSNSSSPQWPYGWNAWTMGGQYGYGLLDRLDLLCSINYITFSGLSLGASRTGWNYGIGIKYNFLKEDALSLAGIVGWGGTKVTPSGGNLESSSYINGGLLVSKQVGPVIPYGGAIYHSMTSDGILSKIIQGNIGLLIPTHEDFNILIEYNYYSLTSNGTPSSQNNIGIAVAWGLPH